MISKKMNKKKYIAPTTIVVKLNIHSLLVNESMGVYSSPSSEFIVTDDDEVY